MHLRLVRPIIEIKNEYLNYINEWRERGECIVPASADLGDESFEKWLEKTYEFEEKEINGFVPAHTLLLINENNKILGAINIRHYLNDYLEKFGGHIGYGVRPSERKKGYANQMLKMALPISKDLGIEKVLITCNKNNIGSAKTIQNNGGILDNELVDNNKNIIQRYWIDIHHFTSN